MKEHKRAVKLPCSEDAAHGPVVMNLCPPPHFSLCFVFALEFTTCSLMKSKISTVCVCVFPKHPFFFVSLQKTKIFGSAAEKAMELKLNLPTVQVGSKVVPLGRGRKNRRRNLLLPGVVPPAPVEPL